MSESKPDELAPAAGEALATPVTSTDRIGSLDVLRGVAIFGILVMNIYGFAMPLPAYMDPNVMGGTDPLNMGVWFFTHIFFDQKFLAIFAMLFGAGIILMTSRAEARGLKFGKIYYRRQLWLMIIGLLHGFFLWWGDILFLYALIGAIAYLFRKKTPRTLVIIACCLLPVALLMSYGAAFSGQQLQAKAAQITALQEAGEELTAQQQEVLDVWWDQRIMMAPDEATIAAEVNAHTSSYAELFSQRAVVMMFLYSGMPIMFGWKVLAMMLIGMALAKTGVLSLERSTSFYRKMVLLGYGVGLPLVVFSAYSLNAHEFDPFYALKVGNIPNYFGSIIVGLGHIGLVMLMIKLEMATRFFERCAAAGRMALTNYLMQSIILTTVFYGYGLGLYGSVSRIEQMGFVVAVIVLQLLYSPWWLERYRFGPAEWLWRSLTYWKRQPMRRLEST